MPSFDIQSIFNFVMVTNKLDLIFFAILIVELFIGFFQGYKKAIYDSVKYIAAFLITRVLYKIAMPWFSGTGIYLKYSDWINGKIAEYISLTPEFISKYPIDRYIFNLILFILIVFILKLAIIGWDPEVTAFDRVAGMVFGVLKAIVILTVIILLMAPLADFFSPGFADEMIDGSKVVDMMKVFNPFIDLRIEF